MKSIVELKRLLISKLRAQGVDTAHIPGFIRCLAASWVTNPQMTPIQVNERLRCMGWHELELDSDTLSKIKGYLNDEALKILENKPSRWFEKIFKAA